MRLSKWRSRGRTRRWIVVTLLVTLAAACTLPRGARAAQWGREIDFTTPGAFLGGLAVDASGDVFVANPSTTAPAYELLPGSSGTIADASVVTLPFTGTSYPTAVAVDGSGDVFLADKRAGQVLELAPGPDGQYADGTPTTVPFQGLQSPSSVAFNRAGDLFVADGSADAILEMTPGPDGSFVDGTQTAVPLASLSDPSAVAIDKAGDLFIVDLGSSVVELSPGADGSYADGTQTTLPYSALAGPQSVAVDGSGNVFVVSEDGAVDELSPDAKGSYVNSAQVAVPFSGTSPPYAAGEADQVATDSAGDVFVSFSGPVSFVNGQLQAVNGSVEELLSSPQAPPSAALSTIAASPASVPADGTTTSTVTVTARDPQGNQEARGGSTVAISTTEGTLSAVDDHGNGSYTATLTSTKSGIAVVKATIDGVALTSKPAYVLFTSAVPTVSALNVHTGSTYVPTELLITGTNFKPGAQVALSRGTGTKTVTVPVDVLAVNSATSILGVVDSAVPTGLYSVRVTTASGTSRADLASVFLVTRKR